MDWILGIALVAGFGPVLLMMDWVLKNYTYPRVENPFFRDSTLFGMMVVGIIEGAVCFFAIRTFTLLESPYAIVYMIIMAIVELMAMVVVMNLKRFRGKSDSVFYGYSLGLGFAAGMAAGFAYVLCALTGTIGAEDTFSLAVYVIMLSFSITFIFGACGTNIGEGIARHLPMQFLLQAAIPLVAYNMLFAACWTANAVMFWILLLAMLILGAFYFHKILFVNLPGIVRDVLKMNGEKRSDIPKTK